MWLTVVAMVASLSASGSASGQTSDTADFRLSVAYCFGTRTQMIKEIEEYRRHDCMANGLPGRCDFDRQVMAAFQSEAERLSLYLFSKFGDGAGDKTDVMATERGIQTYPTLAS